MTSPFILVNYIAANIHVFLKVSKEKESLVFELPIITIF